MRSIAALVCFAGLLALPALPQEREEGGDGKPGRGGGRKRPEGRGGGGEEKDIRKLVTEEGIREFMQKLASDEMGGRLAGEESGRKAAQYIEDRLREAGLKPPPRMDSHRQEFKFSQRTQTQMGQLGRGGKTTANVVGYLQGSDSRLRNEIVILGAHYDHCGRAGDHANPGRIGGPLGGDDVWNGANDNGSGCSALLAFARALGSGGYRPKRSILLIAFSAEEHGLLGASHYCANPIVDLNKTHSMLNMDSIGRMKDERNRQLEVFQVSTSSAWRETVAPIAKEFDVPCAYFNESWPSGLSADHVPFKRHGVASLGFFTGIVPERHKPNDHAELIDYDGLTRIARMIFRLALVLADMGKPMPK